MPALQGNSEQVQIALDGSSATDVSTLISSSLLSYLTNSAKTLLLSAASIGTSVTAKVATALEVIDTLTELTVYHLSTTSINSLSDASYSDTFTVSNIGTSSKVRVVLLLGSFTPQSGATVLLSNGTIAYELSVPTTTSDKRLEFNNLPASFIASFKVQNKTGVSFSSYANSLMVIPL